MIMMPTFLFFLVIFLVFCFMVFYKIPKSRRKEAEHKEPTATTVHSDLAEHSDKPANLASADSPDGADKAVHAGSPETSGIAGISETSGMSQTPAQAASGNLSGESGARDTDNALGESSTGSTSTKGIADRIDRTDPADQLNPAVHADRANNEAGSIHAQPGNPASGSPVSGNGASKEPAPRRRRMSWLWYATLPVLSLAIGATSIRTVPASHFGVVTLWGEVTETVLGEGLHFINPLAKVHRISVGLDTANTQNAEAASKDLQTVQTSITVNFRVNPLEVRKLYIQNPNLQYQTQFVLPAIKEVLKAVTSHYTAEELVTRRPDVSTRIREQLATKLGGYHLQVQDINITNFEFSKTFNESIENKVRATQEAERAQRDLERVKFEAEQRIVTAKANAQAIRLQAEAISAQGGAAFVQLEAIKKWDGKLPTYTGAGPVPFVNVATN